MGKAAGAPFIDGGTVRELATMPRLIEALKQAFASPQTIQTPVRHALPLKDGVTMLVMPARGTEVAGVKVVTVNPASRPAVAGVYLLIDARNGQSLAMIDAAMLTPRRTAAASGLASDYLARRDARRLLMVGTGTLSSHLVEAHASVRSLDEVMIWGRDCDKAEATATGLRMGDVPATAVVDLESAVRRADIVSVATLSNAPLIKGAWLKTGAHLDLVGAFKPTMREADPECFARARVFVDTREGTMEEAGDMLAAIEAGLFCEGAIAGDLAGLCSGRSQGRPDDDAITLFKSVGTALEDLVAAELIYRNARDA